jgi:glycerol uptake facilitator protein
MGTLVLLLFGDGVVASVVLFLGFNGGNGAIGTTSGSASWILINFGWAFAVTFGIYVAGTLTGAHINPAVTLGMALRRGFPWAKVPWYWLAQTLGAFVAAAIIFIEYNTGISSFEKANGIVRGQPSSINTGIIFYTTARTAIGGTTVPIWNAFFDQVLGTALLLFLILAVVDLRNAPPAANLAPFIIGLIVGVIGMSFGVNAGYAINPARDFGPRLFAAFAGWGSVALPGPSNYFWVPILGPLVGAVIGVFVYDYTIHDSLVNRFGPVEGLAEEGRTVTEEERTTS